MVKTMLVASCFVAAVGWSCSGGNPTSNDGPFTLSIAFPSQVTAGDTARFTLRLTNTACESVQFVYEGFVDQMAFDVIVTRPDAVRVWSRSRGTVLPAAHKRVLAPGETIVLAADWDLRDDAGNSVPTGEYRVVGVVYGGEVDSTEPLRTDAKPLTISP